jgi:hypothetical protein
MNPADSLAQETKINSVCRQRIDALLHVQTVQLRVALEDLDRDDYDQMLNKVSLPSEHEQSEMMRQLNELHSRALTLTRTDTMSSFSVASPGCQQQMPNLKRIALRPRFRKVRGPKIASDGLQSTV